MKKYILLVMFISLFIYACDNDDNNKGHIDPVSNVECIPFIGSVTLNWMNPTDANYYYTLISYRNSQGENVNKKVSKYSAASDVYKRQVNIVLMLITTYRLLLEDLQIRKNMSLF